MVSYNHLNQPHHPKSSSKMIGGTILLILGIIVFFCAVFVPIMLDNIFLMFPFFFGGFIIIVIGAVTLMIGIRNRSMVTGNFSGSRIMKLFGNKNQVNNQQNPTVRYESQNQENLVVRKKHEIICSYCGASNNPQSEYCIGCNSKLDI